MANLSLWVLLLPLLGFIILGLLGRFLSRSTILTVAWGACGLAFLLAALNFFSMLGTPAASRVSDQAIYTWVISGATAAHPFSVTFGLLLDPLSATMLLIVTGVGLLIHIYSAGYMEGDPGFWRFFAYMNFFIFAMVLLVTANNFLFLLVGWGLVGLASFLLIGFWYQRRSAVAAAQKAFVINVIGDFGLMLAIFLIFLTFGFVDYHNVFANVSKQLPVGSITATAITLLLFLACTAKSAQLPLYMWLPDAMEGPTPVSALIHAATMVTAGVYLVARAHPLFEAAPIALNVVAGIGGATALFAASIALFQLDIKRVLAYSTISQLGYMFMGEGVRNYTSGIFHLTTHAYFKALLFLAAGAVIHALAGEQDMRKMGGLRQRLPITFWTFLLAALAISGIPPLSGFWSKDEILGSLLGQASGTGNPWFYVLWGVGLLTAALTAFYMFRLFFGIFLGNYRGAAAVVHTGEEHEAEEEEENGHAHHRAVAYYDIHEAPGVMTFPLVVLALLSVIGGFVGSFALFGPAAARWSPLANFLAPVLGQPHEISLVLNWTSTGLSIVAGLLGILVAWLLYRRGFAYKENANPLYQFAFHKYYVDEALSFALVKPVEGIGRLATRGLEGFTLDGASRGIGSIFRGFSTGLRYLQSGYMRNYALAILIGAVLIIVYYVVRG
ncbi:MAG: NADH-quinone oxidoreductase subunit L [Ktedonobacteraceae bacterium]|nr:NADH-quinone oxidoreductase subunit L [Ktedonobacteraceae bacterium]